MPPTTLHLPKDRAPHPATSRDLPIDALRAAAVGMVVVGHAIVAAVAWRDGRPIADNLLATSPLARGLTWVFQVLPLVFLCGGVAAAHSAGRPGWLAGRIERLVTPVTSYLAVVGAGLGAAWGAGLLDAGSVEVVGRAMAMHLWFLAAFVLVMALVPVLLVAASRFGWRAVPAALLAAGLVDGFAGWLPAVGWLNVVVVWGLCAFLGVLRATGHRWPGGRRGAALSALLALAGLVVLVRYGGYPVSMVGVPGAGRSNAGPPSLAMALLALAQAGAFTALADGWKPGRPALVATANRVVMGAYLWQFAGIVLAAVLLLPTGVLPSPATGSGAWWAWRPVWVVACLLAVGAVLAAVGQRATGRPAPGRPGRPGTAVAAAAAVAGFVLVTTSGVTASLGFLAGCACLAVARLAARRDPTGTSRSREPSVADLVGGGNGARRRENDLAPGEPRSLRRSSAVARVPVGVITASHLVIAVRSSAQAQTTPTVPSSPAPPRTVPGMTVPGAPSDPYREVLPFGDARFFGTTYTFPAAQPIVDLVPTPGRTEAGRRLPVGGGDRA